LSEVVKRKVKKRIEMKMLPFGDFHLFYLKTKEKYLALTLLFLGKEREKFACFFKISTTSRMVGVQINNEQSNKLHKCVYIENIPSFEE
jgi:hypothetical protein